MKMVLYVAIGVVSVTAIYIVSAYSQQPSDPVYWCNVSRAQISNERDTALAQVEVLKVHIKELEDKATAAAPKKETPK